MKTPNFIQYNTSDHKNFEVELNNVSNGSDNETGENGSLSYLDTSVQVETVFGEPSASEPDADPKKLKCKKEPDTGESDYDDHGKDL